MNSEYDSNLLSIVYITRNRCDELEQSIISCENHVTMGHEYVVIDNGSTDNTEVMINQLIENGYNIRYLLMDKNYGVAGGRNIGFLEAKGDICYFIDDDATLVSNETDALDKAYLFLKSREDIYALGTDCYDVERKSQLISPVIRGQERNTINQIRSFVGCSHFIKKISFYSEYLYPDNLMYGSEELYFGFSTIKNGGKIFQYPGVKVIHKPSSNTRESQILRRRHGHINTYVIKKYFIPFPFLIHTHIMFLFRIARFNNYNIVDIFESYRTVKKRFDKKYIRKLRLTQVVDLIRKFGIRSIL